MQSIDPDSNVSKDESELAKALAGIGGDMANEDKNAKKKKGGNADDSKDGAAVDTSVAGMPATDSLPEMPGAVSGLDAFGPAPDPAMPAFEPTPVEGQPEAPAAPAFDMSAFNMPTDAPAAPEAPAAAPEMPAFDMGGMGAGMDVGGGNADLDAIKMNALSDLKPILDKVSLPPEEGFKLRMTMLKNNFDASLVAPTYEAAKQITDDTARAQALLDVIKEIDTANGK